MQTKLVKAPKYESRIVFLCEDMKQKPRDFSGKKGEVLVIYETARTVIYCGLGKKKDCTPRIVKSAAAIAIRKVIELQRDKISIIDPRINSVPITAILEGVLLGSYTFSKYKSEKPHKIKMIEIVSDLVKKKDIDNTAILCDSICFSRDLINDNANVITPARLAKEAEKLTTLGKNMSCKVLTEKEINKENLNLVSAVGQGAPYPPRLVIMEYTGNPQTEEKTAIIGKGVTFDSGGLNLKSSTHIDTMRSDMAGAAVVLGLMKALVMLQSKINVIGIVSSVYNAIGSRAYIPGDIVKSYSGKTIEVLNTDAEGRLILADAISYCIAHYAPSQIIDFATLTGSIVTSLGTTIAGLFSNNDALAKKLFECGEASGELLWRLPIYEEHHDSMKSDLADLRNLSKFKRGCAGSITSAAFLEAFVENIPWAHIDIAGVAFNEGESLGEMVKYATGFGIRLMMHFLTQ